MRRFAAAVTAGVINSDGNFSVVNNKIIKHGLLRSACNR